jgi:hypothetical protein
MLLIYFLCFLGFPLEFDTTIFKYACCLLGIIDCTGLPKLCPREIIISSLEHSNKSPLRNLTSAVGLAVVF